jgi:hypothetical protein
MELLESTSEILLARFFELNELTLNGGDDTYTLPVK